MFVLWYCYKRGREERLDKEKTNGEAAEGQDAEHPQEQLPDMAASHDRGLEAAAPHSSATSAVGTQEAVHMSK